MPLALQLVFYSAAAFWLCYVIGVLRNGATLKPLPRLPDAPPAPLPKVSAIIPARDEGARIEQTVRHLFAQRHADLEVIIADDRSTDATPQILAKLRSEFPALKVVRIDSLPENWLGKCHAMHTGATAATGDCLVFADGDVHLAPDIIARAVAAAQETQADHVTITPSQTPPTPRSPLYQAAMTFFAMSITIHLGRANRDKPESMSGIGAFNLVRTDAYRTIDGHRPLRLEVADDMKLGLLLRRHGKRSRCFIGGPDVQCDWASSTPGIIKALEKNSFSMTGYRLWPLLLGTLCFLAVFAAAVSAYFFLPHPAAIAAGGAFALFCLTSLVVALPNGFSPLVPLFMPLAPFILLAAAWNSAIKTLRAGGIRWRDTFYPLSALRAGRFR